MLDAGHKTPNDGTPPSLGLTCNKLGYWIEHLIIRGNIGIIVCCAIECVIQILHHHQR